jgi:hypothetical protein
MKFPFRRTPEPAPEPEPEPELPPLAPGLEREIAAGSLSGVTPAEIGAHLLLVIDGEGTLRVTGSACSHIAVLMLTDAAAILARQNLAGHVHGTED